WLRFAHVHVSRETFNSSTFRTTYRFTPRKQRFRRTISRMNVVLIIADGLQAGALGPYGNDWLPTPTLDRLAVESVVFDAHFANAPAAGMPAISADLQSIEMDGLLPPWNPPQELLDEVFDDWN